jgi:hypothetical protein
MPTLIQFISGKAIVVEEDFDTVMTQLHGQESGDFARMQKNPERTSRTVVLRSAVSFMQEIEASDVYRLI